MPPVRPSVPLLVLLLCAGVGGCSGDPGPHAWATSVCAALTPWRTEIGTLATRTRQQMTAATSPGQAKENLVRLFGGAESASERARRQVADAGVPDVANGAAVATSFTASLGAMRDAYGRARSGVEALATSPATAFYTRVAAVVDTLNAEYSRSQPDTSRLDSAELKRAFDEVPACR